MRGCLRASLFVAACCAVSAQTFETAAVKPAAPLAPGPGGRMIFIGGKTGGPGTKDPGKVRYPMTSLRNLLGEAYSVKPYQITGPAVLDTEQFEITATLAPDTTKEQFHVMLQNLLAERFGLKVHRETKELPMYSLVLAKGGPKMKESAIVAATQEAADAGPVPGAAPMKLQMGPDGFPILPAAVAGRPGVRQMMMPGRARMIAQQQTMQDFASQLTGQLKRPVTDATGLTAKYDFTLTYLPEGMTGPMGPAMARPAEGGGGPPLLNAADAETPQDLLSAVQSQLGLKLEAKKGPVELIVVDHVEKTPTEN